MTTTPAPGHVLVATLTRCSNCPPDSHCEECREFGDLDFSIECPGVTDRCRRWDECMACTRRARTDTAFAELLHEQPEHGVQHAWIAGMWCTPTDGCYVQQADELPDAAVDIAREPGRYPVDHDFDDGLVLFPLAQPAGADQ